MILLLEILVWSTLLHELQGAITQDEECLRTIKADVVFLIDGTNAIDQFSFEFFVKDYLNDFARKLSIKTDGVLISVILYTENLYMAVRPEHSTNLLTLLTAIRNMKQPGGHKTNGDIIHAISNTLNIAFTSLNYKNTENITRIAILLSNGVLEQESSMNYKYFDNNAYQKWSEHGWNNQAPYMMSEPIIKLLHSRVDYVFSIGIVGANAEGVLKLAKPTRYNYVLNYQNGYQNLDLNHFDPTEALCPPKEYCNMNRVQESMTSKGPIERVNGYIGGVIPLYYYFYGQQNPAIRHNTYHTAKHSYTDYDDGYGDSEYDDATQMQVPSTANKPKVEDKILNKKLRELLELLRTYDTQYKNKDSKNTHHSITTTRETSSHNNHHGNTAVKQNHPSSTSTINTFTDDNQQKIKKGSDVDDPAMKKSLKNDETYYNRSNCEVQLEKVINLLVFVLMHPQGASNSPVMVNSNVLSKTSDEKLEAVSPAKLLSDLQKANLQIVPAKVEEYSTPVNERDTEKPHLSNTDFYISQQNGEKVVHTNKENIYFQPTDWQDSAMHNGAVLMFAMKSHSGLPVSEIYSSTADTSSMPSLSGVNVNPKETQPTGNDNKFMNSNTSRYWYKNPLFNHWNSGLYKYVLLELWSNHNPVVQLKFRTQNSDKYTWFNKAFLETSYPWNENELKEKAKFIRTRNEPFSVILDPNYINSLSSQSFDEETLQKVKSERINCEFLRGYILIIDSSDSAISLCEWNIATNKLYSTYYQNNNLYPKFLYTLPINLPKQDNLTYTLPPKFSNYLSTLYEADELRIYVIPYSLMSTIEIGNKQLPQINKLLLTLDINTNISLSQLWHQEIASPPSSFPLKNGNLCNCWYRNELLNNWYTQRHYHRQNLNHFLTSDLFYDFKYIQIDLLNITGHVKCRLAFDTRGAQPDSWFSPTRLKYAWPLSISSLTEYNFIQFGHHITRKGEKRSLSQNWQQIDFWIGKQVLQPQLLSGDNNNYAIKTTCLSIFFVYSIKNEADTFTLPECMKDQVGIFKNSKLTTLTFSKELKQLNSMHQMRQIIIWTN
uniref:VWFA domain-containing protein n=1 Tax=Trichobilharzia regenti TaxID=157069 RepID=A0AA85JV04_TRIRE|nr:unnamed protein product [Trichobilharzia regenti]